MCTTGRDHQATFGSVLETLMRLFTAEEGCAQHFNFTGTAPRPAGLTTFPGFDELQRRVERSGKELIAISEQGTCT